MNQMLIDYNDDQHAPPWKTIFYPSQYEDVSGIWGVTTDRGDPSDEYDVNDDPPEWLVELEAAAPKLLELCKKIVKRYKYVQYGQGPAYRECSPLLGAISDEIEEIEEFIKGMEND